VRSYETTFIINPQTDDATIEKQVNDVASIITDNKGNILHKDFMGTRRLAYEIEKLTHGYYTSFIFEGEPSILPKLDRHFKLNEAYIRALTVRFEGSLEDLNKDEIFDSEKTVDSKETEKVQESSKPSETVEESTSEETTTEEKSDEEDTVKEVVTEEVEPASEESISDEAESTEATETTEAQETNDDEEL
jgi:small subunit ribosomal protein S6